MISGWNESIENDEKIEKDWLDVLWVVVDCKISERNCDIYMQIRWQLRRSGACEDDFALLVKLNFNPV